LLLFYFLFFFFLLLFLLFNYSVAALLKSFDVAKQIERLELPEVRALGSPKHRQQVIVFISTRLYEPARCILFSFSNPKLLFYRILRCFIMKQMCDEAARVNVVNILSVSEDIDATRCRCLRVDIKGSDVSSVRSLLVVEERMSFRECFKHWLATGRVPYPASETQH